VKKVIKYNLIITIIQFIIFAALLFAVFFFKFNDLKKGSHNTEQGFVIEKLNSKLKM